MHVLLPPPPQPPVDNKNQGRKTSEPKIVSEIWSPYLTYVWKPKQSTLASLAAADRELRKH